MRRFRNKNILFALSWLAILLAAAASADVVEDLVFEPFETGAAGSPLPQPDLEDPAENATVRSAGGHVPGVKTAGAGVGLAGTAGGLAALLFVLLFYKLVVWTSDHTVPPSTLGFLIPLRI